MKTAQIHPSQSISSLEELKSHIKDWGNSLGFADIGISDIDLSQYEADYFNWIGESFHGEMEYMSRHGAKRTRPNELEPGTTCIISVRMNYLDTDAYLPTKILHQSEQAYISRYALGKDYHKLIRKRLQQLANKIDEVTENFRYRAFTDSAPVLERPIAEKAGLGFIGKNSLIIHPRAGSWFFLGEIYCNLPLQSDPSFEKQGCGPCTACIAECPTQAIIGDTTIDARRCISYLTIEYKGSIAEEFRPLMGNRIYGCDDCQLVCPWNKFTSSTTETSFQTNKQLDQISLFELWNWDEETFLRKLEGSPIRRIGYQQWKRNLSIALGNVKSSTKDIEHALVLLKQPDNSINDLVREHADWAIRQLEERLVEYKQRVTELNCQNHSIKPFVAAKYYLPKQQNQN